MPDTTEDRAAAARRVARETACVIVTAIRTRPDTTVLNDHAQELLEREIVLALLAFPGGDAEPVAGGIERLKAAYEKHMSVATPLRGPDIAGVNERDLHAVLYAAPGAGEAGVLEARVACPDCQERVPAGCENCEGSGTVPASEILGSDARLRALRRSLLYAHNDPRTGGCLNVSRAELRALLDRIDAAPPLTDEDCRGGIGTRAALAPGGQSRCEDCDGTRTVMNVVPGPHGEGEEVGEIPCPRCAPAAEMSTDAP